MNTTALIHRLDVFSAHKSAILLTFFHHKIFNTTILLNHVAPSVELIMKRWAIWYR